MYVHMNPRFIISQILCNDMAKNELNQGLKNKKKLIMIYDFTNITVCSNVCQVCNPPENSSADWYNDILQ